MKTELDLGR